MPPEIHMKPVGRPFPLHYTFILVAIVASPFSTSSARVSVQWTRDGLEWKGSLGAPVDTKVMDAIMSSRQNTESEEK